MRGEKPPKVSIVFVGRQGQLCRSRRRLGSRSGPGRPPLRPVSSPSPRKGTPRASQHRTPPQRPARSPSPRRWPSPRERAASTSACRAAAPRPPRRRSPCPRTAQLEAAVKNAAAGTVIQVRAGTYYPTATLKSTADGTSSHRITLQAYGSEKVRIDGSRLPAGSWLAGIYGDYWTVQNLTFQNSPAPRMRTARPGDDRRRGGVVRVTRSTRARRHLDRLPAGVAAVRPAGRRARRDHRRRQPARRLQAARRRRRSAVAAAVDSRQPVRHHRPRGAHRRDEPDLDHRVRDARGAGRLLGRLRVPLRPVQHRRRRSAS